MRYSVKDIQKAVALRFNLSLADMRSPARCKRIARPRQVAMFLARELTPASYPSLGRHFGGRDHTTILHGKRNIERLLRETNTMAGEVEGVREILSVLTNRVPGDNFFSAGVAGASGVTGMPPTTTEAA